MSHCDDYDLALYSVEQSLPLPCTCADCVAKLAAYERTVAAARANTQLERPPAAVWDRIAEELAQDEQRPPPEPPIERDPLGEDAILTSEATHRDHDVAAPPLPFVVAPPQKFRKRSMWMLVAGVSVGVALTLGAQQLIPPASPQILAQAELDPLPGWDEAGTAFVEQVGDRRELVVELPEIEVDGFREVWLIDRDVQRLISVGVLTSNAGRFAVPADVDLDEFAIVDISDEPMDGDPAHSGNSIVRGVLAG